jgi:hypothetical protein
MINILWGAEQERSRVMFYTIKKGKSKAISVTGCEGP